MHSRQHFAFVLANFPQLYGCSKMFCSVYALIHVTEDAMSRGALVEYICFPYEFQYVFLNSVWAEIKTRHDSHTTARTNCSRRMMYL